MSFLITLIFALSGFVFYGNCVNYVGEFGVTANTLPWTLYGAMIGYRAQDETVVLVGGRSGEKEDLNTDYIEIDVSNIRLIEGTVNVTSGAAIESPHVMFEYRSVAIGDAIYYLSVGENGRNVTWEIFNVTSKTNTTKTGKDLGMMITGVTLCSDSETRIFVSLFGVNQSNYYSRCMEYVVETDTWQQVTNDVQQGLFAYYGSCVWRESTNEIWYFGGKDYSTEEPLSNIWSVEYATGNVLNRGNLIIPRMVSGAFLVKDADGIENVLVTGGCLKPDEQKCAISVTSTEMYNLTANMTSAFAPYLNEPLAQFAAIIRNNVLWLFGGTSDNGNSNVIQYLNMSMTTWDQLTTHTQGVETICISTDSCNLTDPSVYVTMSLEDAIEKVIWLSSNVSSETVMYFGSSWKLTSNRVYHWFIGRNASIRMDCLQSVCTITGINSIFMSLALSNGNDDINVGIAIQNIRLIVIPGESSSSSTSPSGQILTTVLDQTSNVNITVQIRMTNITFNANHEAMYGILIRSSVGRNNLLVLEHVTVLNTTRPFLLLEGSDMNPTGWDVELNDITVFNHSFSDGEDVCSSSVFCLTSVGNVNVSHWSIWHSFVSASALIINGFNRVMTQNLQLNDTTTKEAPLVLSNGISSTVDFVQCSNTNGMQSGCIVLDSISTVDVSNVYCILSNGDNGCVTATDLGSVQLDQITCVESNGINAGCIYIEIAQQAFLANITCSKTTSVMWSGCVAAIGADNFALNGLVCNTTDPSRAACAFVKDIADAFISNADCSSSIGNDTGCVAARSLSKLTLENILCNASQGTTAACVSLSDLVMVNATRLICNNTLGFYSGCLLAWSVQYIILTQLQVINTFGFYTGAVYVIQSNTQYSIIQDSLFDGNVMGEVAINYGVGAHMEGVYAQISRCVFTNNHGTLKNK
ncbi:hypothetical protein RFI_25487 [Reticulomyxa filosa]|uniref:Uncharacterized protein n=1 Tax=Reticulomyxa filosa TaxID=46433 RepID=X6MFU5_RETFI|nr:hypothetical protein RFI_25487 [Reticulomyxa filosa]|eukprot:ETO11885.1 hypothetical protein RFI_25487 [Reticulomyxa filosa]